MTRAPETRRVRPQAGTSATPSHDAANGVPQRTFLAQRIDNPRMPLGLS